MDEDGRADASPCFAHLLVDGQPVDPGTWADVAVFRRAERERLYAARRALTSADRAASESVIAAALDRALGEITGRVVAAYWPIRGEPDLRGWMAEASRQGALVAVPVVVERDAPVVFRRWSPGCAMMRGVWNIPVPRDGEDVTPDIVIVPLLGVDDGQYRLGNGGGYYDRTLARLTGPRLVIGVGHGHARMPTIFPMPWDVPMDVVLLGDGTVRRRESGGD